MSDVATEHARVAKLRGAIAQLRERTSSKRRSAAKRLRAMADPLAGPALLEALEAEVKDPRTWETQYQMVMALGECGYGPALPFLTQLSTGPLEHAMLGVGVGDALTRIAWASQGTLTPVEEGLESVPPSVSEGSLRALAVLRLAPDASLVARILSFAERLNFADGRHYWVAAAAAGWPDKSAQRYLRRCLKSPRQDVREVARASLDGVYTKHRVL